MRFLIISLLSLSLLSCKTYEEKAGLMPTPRSEKEVQNLYFSDTAKDYIYKAHIDAYGKNYGGILIMKKVSDSSHRVVLATDFGNKLIDFELSETSHQINYVVDELDRKIILNTLVDDFRILLSTYRNPENEFVTDSERVFKARSGKTRLYYFQNNETRLTKIVKSSKTKEKVRFLFDSKSPVFADNVAIEHSNIKLKIKLNQISD